ncbi:hypothetical protein KDW_46610 [Dictyobacter vulcani]|uniref:Phosphoglycerate mutase n=2 Tax=Dictyobacter vulcani TaxID=2607529 RepID=A0A5J4KWJ2_9CHLR|nr:hypothetical protein KDW_46610 [Dictyobacter vulcani]
MKDYVQMLTLFYSPHATSVDNEARRASGYVDVPLSEAGLQQARLRGEQYAQEALDAVYSSDLQRAWRTSEIAFGERGLPLYRDARLREFDYGDMTQHPIEQIDEEIPRRIVEPFPNGESAVMVVQRMGTFLRDVLRDHDGKIIVVIGHRATRYGLLYWCGNTPLAEIVHAPWEWRDIPSGATNSIPTT